MEKLYSKRYLLQKLREAGLPSSTMWIRYVEAKGKLHSPRIPNSRQDRAYTERQIQQIIHAFSPGGAGEWP